MEVRSELVRDIQYLVHLQRAANARVEGRDRERGQRGDSNTVDAHNTTVSLESSMHESTREYLGSTSMFVVSVNEAAAATKVPLSMTSLLY